MKVTTILTSYNRDTLLCAAIESVLAQTFKNHELWIVDDDSDNPKTHKVLDDYEGRPNIHIYRHKLTVPRFSRTGYAENINRAIEWSTGEYLTYLTCDDIFFPTRLERMAGYLDAHPEAMVCYGIQRLVYLQPDGGTRLHGLRNEGAVVPAAACLLDHNQVMHRRSVLQKTGTPLWPTNPEVIGMADAVVWEKFRACGWPFYRIDGSEPTDEHRFHSGSIQGQAKA